MLLYIYCLFLYLFDVCVADAPSLGHSFYLKGSGSIGYVYPIKLPPNLKSLTVDYYHQSFVVNMGNPFSWANPTFFNYMRIKPEYTFFINQVRFQPTQVVFRHGGNWFHHAVTINITSGTAASYINGSLIFSQTQEVLKKMHTNEPINSMVLGINQNGGILSGWASVNCYGLMDEVRIWNTALSASYLKSNWNKRVRPDHPNLIMMWSFDDAEHSGFASPTINPMYASFYKDMDLSMTFDNTATWGSPPPGVQPTPSRLPLSFPFLNDADYPSPTRSFNFFPGKPLSLELIPKDIQSVAKIIALPKFGWLKCDDVQVSTVPISFTQTTNVLYFQNTTDCNSDGFLYEIGAYSISVKINCPSRPRAFNATITVDMDSTYIWDLAQDVSGIQTQAIITSLPSRGALYNVEAVYGANFQTAVVKTTLINRTGPILNLKGLAYEPAPNDYGLYYDVFSYVLVDTTWGLQSNPPAYVKVKVPFTNHLPTLSMKTSYTFPEDTSIEFTINGSDLDDDVVTGLLTVLPDVNVGELYVNGVYLDALRSALKILPQFPIDANYSDIRPYTLPNGTVTYGLNSAIGEPNFWDGIPELVSWSPNVWIMCINIGTPKVFVSSWIQITLKTPVYLISSVIYFTSSTVAANNLARIQAYHPTNGWTKIYMGEPFTTSDPVVNTQYNWTAPICGTSWPVQYMKYDFDSCTMSTLPKVDAIKVTGSIDVASYYVSMGSVLKFVPRPNFNGKVEIPISCSDCLPNPVPGQSVITLTITSVNDAPVLKPLPVFTAMSGGFPVIINASDIDNRTSDLRIKFTSMPSKGSLNVTMGTIYPVPTIVYYIPNSDNPTDCSLNFKDNFAFEVSDGQLSDRGSVDISGYYCKSCSAPYMISPPGYCVPCPQGTVYENGVCKAPTSAAADKSNTGIVIGIVVAGIIILLFLTTMVVLRIRRHIQVKKILLSIPSGDVSIVFTDIQDSTSLWEKYSDMSKALIVHNECIRRLIGKHKGYEVKTVGDSFMIAFQSVGDAVKFALDVQEDLIRMEWPKTLMSYPGYEEIIEEKLGTTLWRGLKVRIGIHNGECDIVVNKNYQADYFGPVVNMAARVESKALGGQILVSQSILDNTTSDLTDEIVIQDMGKYSLKGISEPQTLWCITPYGLQKREFPKVIETIACNRCKKELLCPRCDGDADHRKEKARRISNSGSSIISKQSGHSKQYNRTRLSLYSG